MEPISREQQANPDATATIEGTILAGVGAELVPLQVSQVPIRNPVEEYLLTLAPSGRSAIVRRLHAVADLIGAEPEEVQWHNVRSHHIEAIKAKLTELDKAPNTVNLTLYALKGIARKAWHAGLMRAEEWERIKDVKPAKGDRLPPGRSATPGELDALLNTCLNDPRPAGLRDAALVAVLYAGGMRRTELASLDADDFDPSEASLKVLKAKGNKQRVVYLTEGAARLLEDWLGWREAYGGRSSCRSRGSAR